MERTKIQLSTAEMALVCNADTILTKNRIMDKAKALLEAVQEAMQQAPVAHPFATIPPKISRGENYLGLPYLILDYPRLFGREDVLAVRSFFWWGNFFSSTLQIGGSWKPQLAPVLTAAYDRLVQRGYFIQVGEDPWAHHFDAGNFQAIGHFSPKAFEELLYQKDQIKIAARWPLESWPDAANNLWNSWQFLLSLCAT